MTSTKDYKHDMATMFAFHDALRRELGHIAQVAAASTDDPRLVMATAAGWHMFKTYLHVHHSCEDDMLWPVMEKTLAARADDLALLAALEAEHAAIDPLLNAIDATLANPASGPERLGDLVDALAVTLTAHLRHEEGEGLPLIDATVTDEQWRDFGLENSKRIGPEAPTVFPWMLDGLDEGKTDHILQLVPEPVRALYHDQWLGAYRQLDRWGAHLESAERVG
ncbi:MAG TPA: hemerythrin domain-containing protein [Acidimicrobiales bacterium]|nr:hemerythrin domain-containing protein [Acidimicrobiales bacterium]